MYTNDNAKASRHLRNKQFGVRAAIQPVLAWLFLLLSVFPTISSLADAQELKTEFQDTQPKYIKTETGFEGVCVDIMHELQKRLSNHGMSIVFPRSFTPPKRIRAHLAEGTTDLHCGAARSKKREKIFGFSKQPLYLVNTVVVGRADETIEIRSIDDLIKSQASVSTVYGTNTHRLLSSQNGLLLGPIPRGPEGGLSMVEKGRTRFFIYHDLAIVWIIKQSGKESLFRIQPAVLRHYSHWMMYSPHLDQSVRQLIEDELQELHKSGASETIMASYVFANQTMPEGAATAFPGE